MRFIFLETEELETLIEQLTNIKLGRRNSYCEIIHNEEKNMTVCSVNGDKVSFEKAMIPLLSEHFNNKIIKHDFTDFKDCDGFIFHI